MSPQTPPMDPDGFAASLARAREEIAGVIVGQTELVGEGAGGGAL